MLYILFILNLALAVCEEVDVEVSFVVPVDFNVSNLEIPLTPANGTFLGPLMRMMDISPIVCVLGLNYTYYNCEGADTTPHDAALPVGVIAAVAVACVIAAIAVGAIFYHFHSSSKRTILGGRIIPVLIDWPPKKKTNSANGMRQARAWGYHA
jgi:hypothetical protein